MGTTEQSSPDGFRLFGEPLDHGEGARFRSQARSKGGPTTDTCRIDPERPRREPEGKTLARSPSIEIDSRERSGRINARYEETITCSGCVATGLVEGVPVKGAKPRQRRHPHV